MEEFEGSADCRGMVKPSQQHVAPCLKVVEWELGTRGLRLLLLFLTNFDLISLVHVTLSKKALQNFFTLCLQYSYEVT